MINFVNTCFFKPSLLLKSLCILTWELRSSRFILRWKEMKPFLQYNFFSNRHYFWNPLFACLFAKYVAGGLFDERNEGSFFTWGFRFTRVTVENALLCFTAPNAKRDSVTPKMTFEFAFASQQDDLQTFNQAFLPRKARKESGNSSPVSPGHRSKMAARRWVDRPWSFF